MCVIDGVGLVANFQSAILRDPWASLLSFISQCLCPAAGPHNAASDFSFFFSFPKALISCHEEYTEKKIPWRHWTYSFIHLGIDI